ncbi:MAG: hypothetical protein HOV97_05580 [Nonomuraea sp.]|nr:hypothetical protein [Nonomuraea sp.]
MASGQANYDRIVKALTENADDVIEFVAERLAVLGSKSEWSMDDNFTTTEGLAGLARGAGLPAAGDQDDEGLAFYEAAAEHLGY